MPNLQNYRQKRHFHRTPEPAGRTGAVTGFTYVIQKHAARRLHYDFRLELDGVLLSWAVPKGPSLNPSEKRLATQTEDHPIEYAGFEGTIPKGEYGAGTVMVWDQGTWEPEGDPRRAYEQGHLAFRLRGEKLHGRWHLVRLRDPKGRAWILFKGKDEVARATDGHGEIVDEAPDSVVSGRSLEEIAAGDNPTSPRSAPAAKKARGAPATGTANPGGSPSPKATTPHASVSLSNPERILYAEQGITKRELGEYYAQVADWMLPHVEHRLLTLVRCPEGRHKECFFQKHPRPGMPPAIRSVPIMEKGKRKIYTAIADLEGLMGLVQLGVLEIHVWGSRIEDMERPDRLVFDLDPDPGVPWPRVIEGARRIREYLEQLDLQSFVKTTGGKGLHVVVPVRPELEWEDAKLFCKIISEQLEREEPNRYVSAMSKAARKGKIFVDYLRNGRGATSICAFSTRALHGAPVSVPLAWDELTDRLRSDQYDIRNLPRRLSSLRHDPWEGFFELRQGLRRSLGRLRVA